MCDWQLAYLGERTFPGEVPDFELRRPFTFDHVEPGEIRRRRCDSGNP